MRSKVEGYEGSGISGEAEVTCDTAGRFDVPAITAGLLDIALVFDRDQGMPLRGEPAKGLVLQPGSMVEVPVPLRSTVRVHGLIRDKESKQPIAGVRLVINGQFGGDTFAISNARGEYTAQVVRELNQPFGWPIRIPRPFHESAGAPEVPQRMPPRDLSELALPPLELIRGVDLAGSVVEEDGKPVPDAEVESIDGQALLTRTNRAGKFVLAGVDPLRELKVQARRGLSNSGVSTTTIRAGNSTAGSAQVGDPACPVQSTGRARGRSLGSADCRGIGRIWRQIRAHGGIFLKELLAEEDGTVVRRTDAEGRFRTARPLPSNSEFYVEATAKGRLSARSAAVSPTDPDQSMPDLVLPGCANRRRPGGGPTRSTRYRRPCESVG